MDKPTRNLIQRATQAARQLLEQEYQEQLEGTFDILLDGTMAEEPGAHLSESGVVVRDKLTATVAHKRATGLTPAEAVAACLREAEFTTLNRFVALKMLEARGLVQECISRSEESSGFSEFTALAPGLVALPDKGYRLYIETIFDEIGREVRVLFDRRDVASLLWPRRQTLNDLRDLLDDPSLASVWIEDETIGWVYQYFNGDDERSAARYDDKGKPKAPQDSRELAVRNQFFTPRYVVQFLTDNTLGRTWYEAMRGETKLRDLECLVRRPNEVFLTENQDAPDLGHSAGLSQDELLQRPAYVPFRAKKDPRDLRILDPACGSGHFLLYALDLLLSIYEEAWADPGAAAFAGTGRTLCDDYSDLAELRKEAPGLILRYNLHGIDIDPRAAQVAALALWMRSQRAYNKLGLSRADRPPISKTNIVVAEPMPGDSVLVEEFAATLEPPLIGTLFKKMVAEMKLAGELGSLLQIEETIAGAVRDARQEYVADRGAHRHSYLPGLEPKKRQGELDFSGIDDERFFEEAEESMVDALERFAQSAVGGIGLRRRLFAGDAVQGVAFIDLVRHEFDVVVMNPPFGDATPATAKYVNGLSPGKANNLYAAFIVRALRVTRSQGIVGCICSRTFVKYRKFEQLRRELVAQHALKCMADLGWGVLDGAQVETAAFAVENSSSGPTIGPFYRLVETPVDQKGLALRGAVSARPGAPTARVVDKDHFDHLPGFPLCYWSSNEFISEVASSPRLSDMAYVGQGASPHAFFFRLWWECPQEEVGSRWVRVCRGGDYSPFYRTNNLVIDWRAEGAAVKAYILFKYPYLDGNYGWKIQDEQHYRQRGLTWGKRNERFNIQAMPAGHIFTDEGQGVIVVDDECPLFLLGYLNSALVAYYLSLTSGLQKHYVYLRPVPILSKSQALASIIRDATTRTLDVKMRWAATSEISPLFRGPWPCDLQSPRTLSDAICEVQEMWEADKRVLRESRAKIDTTVFSAADFSDTDIAEMRRLRESFPVDLPSCEGLQLETADCGHEVAESLVSYLVGVAFGRWDWRVASGVNRSPMPGPFDSLPSCSVGMLTSCDGLPLDAPPGDYLIDVPRGGILVDDAGHKSDLADRTHQAFQPVFGTPADTRWNEVAEALDPRNRDLRAWLAREFFELHISRYSKNRRKAPIYWQLATQSGSYSCWLYYQRLTRDTFYRILNDFVGPKLQHEERKLMQLQMDPGSNPTRSQRNEIDEQDSFVGELRAFKAEVARVAALWNPDLNDGVIINFAPLWRLVPQCRSWQKECQKVWDKLVAGEYEWTHLAMHLWPERVVPNCGKDRSLAIAHGLEDAFWVEDNDGKWIPREVESAQIDGLIEDRTSPAVKAALNELLTAPAPPSTTRRKRTPRRGRTGGRARTSRGDGA